MAALTNRYNLPETLYNAIKADHHYSAGDISVSQLIDAPQIRILKKLHRDELTEDVSDKIAAILGTGVHAVLERANQNQMKKSFDDVRNYFISQKNEAPDKQTADAADSFIKTLDAAVEDKFPAGAEDKYIFERTLHITVDDMVISGTFDLYNIAEKKLQDYKTCSTWAFLFPESKTGWTAQLNVYSYMLREHGYEVNEASIVALFKDWSRSKIIQNKDYPKQPVVEIPITLYPHEQIGKWIKERVRLHKQAELGNVPECTSKERWGRADMYALMAKGAKRALKVVETKQGAEKLMEINKDNYEGLYIEHRPGENKRCDEYCAVKDFCPQRKRMTQQT